MTQLADVRPKIVNSSKAMSDIKTDIKTYREIKVEFVGNAVRSFVGNLTTQSSGSSIIYFP